MLTIVVVEAINGFSAGFSHPFGNRYNARAAIARYNGNSKTTQNPAFVPVSSRGYRLPVSAYKDAARNVIDDPYHSRKPLTPARPKVAEAHVLGRNNYIHNLREHYNYVPGRCSDT